MGLRGPKTGARPQMDTNTLHHDRAFIKNSQELPRELQAAILKHNNNQQRAIAREGLGATDVGRAITKRFLGTLSSAFAAAITVVAREGTAEAKMLKVVRGLDPDVIALAVLQRALSTMAHEGGTQLAQSELMGVALAGECWAAGLIETDAKRAKAIAKRVKLRHGSTAARLIAAKREASQSYQLKDGTQVNAYQQREWPKDLKLRAGNWALNVLTEALPHVFRWRDQVISSAKGVETYRFLEVTDEAWAEVEQVMRDRVMSRPVWFPSLTPPKPWDAWIGCGSHDDRINFTTKFLRSRYKGTGAAVRAAIKDGSMQPALDGVNALQGVAYTINADIFDIIAQCYERGISVKGLPAKGVTKPMKRLKDAQWDVMDAGQRKLHKLRKAELKQLADEAKCDRAMLEADMAQARELAVEARFHTPMNCDWRGRVYALSHFNFQREDRVRALFLFADGEPIGVEGLRWLKIHTANCGAFNKVDKRPMEERVKWVDDNMDMIRDIVRDPLNAGIGWTEADKPFLFLASCMELVAALKAGPSYTTTIPVSFDGSCSGLQHLSAMTRAAEGSLVNLTPSPEPQDVYATVAVLVNERLRAVLLTEPENTFDDEEVKKVARERELARLALDFGIGRGEVKRAVMTYAYSSKTFGMACQLQTDLMKPLAREVLEGVRDFHPFAPYDQGTEERPSGAAQFLAHHAFRAIETIVHKPSEAMKYLQKLARALAHEGKPLRWTSPVGIPWINRYHDPITKRVELWLNDGGVRVRSQITVAVDNKPEVNKEKSSNGVAPNFVHALDAAHLLLVASAARARGITSIATVHDSFGCLPSRATEFNAVIRETFAEMYEQHDVLAEILAQARADLTDCNSDRLPDAIEMGPLNLKDILNADFAFA